MAMSLSIHSMTDSSEKTGISQGLSSRNAAHRPMNRISRIILSILAVVLIFTIGISGVSAVDGVSVALGDKVDIHGTNPQGDSVCFYVTGPEFPFAQILKDGKKLTASGKSWEITLDTSKIRFSSGKHLKIGEYTLYISRIADATSINDLDSSFTTVPLLLTGIKPGADIYLGTVYAYGLYNFDAVNLGSYQTWTDNHENSITFLKDGDDGYYIDGYGDIGLEGLYFCSIGDNRYSIDFKMPSVPITGAVYKGSLSGECVGDLIGSTVPNDMYITITGATDIALTSPDGSLTVIDDGWQEVIGLDKNVGSISKLALGEWTAQAVFIKGNTYDELGGVIFSKIAPDIIYGKPYKFTVVGPYSKKLTSFPDEIFEGEIVSITMTAPVGIYDISVNNGILPDGQRGVDYSYVSSDDIYRINVPLSGYVFFDVQSTSTYGNELKVSLLNENGEVETSTTVRVLSEISEYNLTVTPIPDGSINFHMEYQREHGGGSGGGVSLGGGVLHTSFPAGAVITLSAIADMGYVFKEWEVISGGITMVNNHFTMPANDVEINAIFELDPELIDTLYLSNGWNFVSVPKKLSADYNTAAELFDGVNTSDNAILSYNAKTQVWEQVKADTEIVPLNAYWIYSVDEKVITPTFDTGAYVPASKAVYKGWNAVGISAEKPMTAANAFNNINWRTYLMWNPTTHACDITFIKGNKETYSEDSFINLWKGGWLFMDEDNTIIGYV